jgi:hypothetical protein
VPGPQLVASDKPRIHDLHDPLLVRHRREHPVGELASARQVLSLFVSLVASARLCARMYKRVFIFTLVFIHIILD